jgi:hypothetical protein
MSGTAIQRATESQSHIPATPATTPAAAPMLQQPQPQLPSQLAGLARSNSAGARPAGPSTAQGTRRTSSAPPRVGLASSSPASSPSLSETKTEPETAWPDVEASNSKVQDHETLPEPTPAPSPQPALLSLAPESIPLPPSLALSEAGSLTTHAPDQSHIQEHPVPSRTPQTPHTPLARQSTPLMARAGELANTGSISALATPAIPLARLQGRPGDIETGGPLEPARRLDQTRSRLEALSAPIVGAFSALPGVLRAVPGVLKAAPAAINNQAALVMRNEFGSGDALKGWGANAANTLSHELLATGGTTLARELVDMGAEAIINATKLTPEQQGLGVALLFVGAAGANVMAMIHKNYRGTSIPTTNRGHMLQIAALLGSMTAAGLVGRGGANGQFGVMSTLLPSAVKSVAYLSRDVINLLVPLNGNRDDKYTRPVAGQAADVSYIGTEEAVNTGQDFAGASGVGVLDALMSHSLGLSQAVGKLTGYVGLNTVGEAIANVSVRAANEVSIGGWNSAATLQGIKDIRLQYGKYDPQKGSFQEQFFDKMAGAGIARLSLFLSLYAVTAVLGHALGNTSMAVKTQDHIGEAVGAALILAGCIPFAMSTSSKPVATPAVTVSASQPADEATLPSGPASLRSDEVVVQSGRLSAQRPALGDELTPRSSRHSISSSSHVEVP